MTKRCETAMIVLSCFTLLGIRTKNNVPRTVQRLAAAILRETMAQTPNAVLSDATAEECGSFERRDDVFIRPYPFPFVAGFALSNDCDSSGTEAFEDWHGFVNGRDATSYGDGLALEIGDSFWIWVGKSRGLSLCNGFADQPTSESAHVDRITELGRLGWFDSLHSLGNWDQDYKSFRHDLGTRADVERGLEFLDRKGLKPFVYTNHSWSPSNVSGPWGYYQKVDDPSHPMYGMDLLRTFGFRYFWTDSAVEMEKFGDQLRFQTDSDARAAIAAYPQWKLIYRRIGPQEFRLIDLPSDAAAKRSLLLAMFNRTIIRVSAMDGLPMAAFKRYRGPWPADESSFHLQASAENFDSLEQAAER